jgi:quinolinate synthase
MEAILTDGFFYTTSLSPIIKISAYMKVITLEKLYDYLRDETPQILVAEAVAKKALIPIERMLELSK